MPSPLLIAVDAAPLGLLSNPTRSEPVAGAWEWASARLADGCRIVAPEIADYEVRRELIRAGGGGLQAYRMPRQVHSGGEATEGASGAAASGVRTPSME